MKEKERNLSKNDKNILKINEKKEVFFVTREELEIIDGEYCHFVLGDEKFKTIKYLTECFYGEFKTS